MNVVFLSNYFNHHQKPLSDALEKQCNYHFIATADITQERRNLGWGYDQEPEYVCHYSLEKEQAEEILSKADVVIAGSAPESLVRKCILRGQLVFRYLERPLKNGFEPLKYIPRLIRWHFRNPSLKPIYLLCASGYTAGDYAKFGLFRDKAFRWGYFPETKKYDSIESVMEKKKPASLLWVGRFLDWKHPDDAIAVAAALRDEGYSFTMSMIGTGPMEQTLREMIQRKGMEDCVYLLGSMTPEMVRRNMEESEIFLVTSDRREGWGAVLNEAMNSGCAVVASDAVGAAPFLVKDGENGCVYHSGNIGELYRKVKSLLENTNQTKQLGTSAYMTIINYWNGGIAAQRLLCLIGELMKGKNGNHLFSDGPCSLAPCTGKDWYRKDN